jgi:tRNA U34 5-carboxymethylaminomethyl modifying enzyme MnmG/GidA
MNSPGRGHIYDVAIVGAGICGTEAALECAKAGVDVLLITTILDTCYNLAGERINLEPPANTFMAKAFAKIADNKGFVSSWELHRAAKYELEHTPGIHFLQSSVSSLMTEGSSVIGINTWEGVPRYARNVAFCVGSFLEARLTIGSLTEQAGRLSEMSYDDLYLDLLARGFSFETLHLKAESVNDSPSYTVTCKVFKDETNPNTFEVERLNNLYGAGTCAFGYVSYEAAARQGQALAQWLIKAAKAECES